MPDIDVSVALTSPMLCDAFKVFRRTSVQDTFGRAVIKLENVFATHGVVQAANPSRLDRGSDQQNMKKSLSVVTQFRLRGPSNGYQPDLIKWHNDFFIVTDLQDYSAFGPGFTEATVESIDSTDYPSEEQPPA